VSLWVKICGNTSLADTLFAVEAGANAVGFVFAPSPRQVTASQVATITPNLPSNIEKVGVFVDAHFEDLAQTVRADGLTGVQLHSDASSELPAKLREEFGPNLRIIRVVHFANDAKEQLAALAADPNTDAVLVDSRSATAVGGTGIAFDWQAAKAALFAGVHEKKMIAAGGLKPENVAQAVATLAPWGVDVSSGVESAPGRKDRAKVLAFVVNARTAHDPKKIL
jgi:phosphoribosylanthranilate isomerase